MTELTELFMRFIALVDGTPFALIPAMLLTPMGWVPIFIITWGIVDFVRSRKASVSA